MTPKKALQPAQAVVTFEVFNREEKFKVAQIIGTSPRGELDGTLLRFDEDSLAQDKVGF